MILNDHKHGLSYHNQPFQRAVVIKSTLKENIGKIVLIIDRADFTDARPGTMEVRFGSMWKRGALGETVWVVKSLGETLHFVSVNGGVVRTDIGYFSDLSLMPLPDEDDCTNDLEEWVDGDAVREVLRKRTDDILGDFMKQYGKKNP